jgi:hypothetical protein
MASLRSADEPASSKLKINRIAGPAEAPSMVHPTTAPLRADRGR